MLRNREFLRVSVFYRFYMLRDPVGNGSLRLSILVHWCRFLFFSFEVLNILYKIILNNFVKPWKDCLHLDSKFKKSKSTSILLSIHPSCILFCNRSFKTTLVKSVPGALRCYLANLQNSILWWNHEKSWQWKLSLFNKNIWNLSGRLFVKGQRPVMRHKLSRLIEVGGLSAIMRLLAADGGFVARQAWADAWWVGVFVPFYCCWRWRFRRFKLIWLVFCLLGKLFWGFRCSRC